MHNIIDWCHYSGCIVLIGVIARGIDRPRCFYWCQLWDWGQPGESPIFLLIGVYCEGYHPHCF